MRLFKFSRCWNRRLGFGALAAMISFLSAVALIEVTLTLSPAEDGTEGRALRLLGWNAAPDSEIEGLPTNSEGFTGAVLPRKRENPEEIRVLLLGASVLFYLDLSKRLEAELAPLTSWPLKVVGAALPTHTSASSRIKYMRYFRRHDFDYVFICHGINDLWSNHHPPEVFRADYSHMTPWYRRGWLLNHSLCARRIYNAWIWRKPPRVRRWNLSKFAACRSFERNLSELVRAIRADGSRPVLMTFASYISKPYSDRLFRKGELDYAPATNHATAPIGVWGSVEFVKEGLRRHNEITRRIAADQSVPLLDQASLVGGVATNFVDVCHLSEEGGRRFTGNLIRFLADRLAEEPEP